MFLLVPPDNRAGQIEPLPVHLATPIAARLTGLLHPTFSRRDRWDGLRHSCTFSYWKLSVKTHVNGAPIKAQAS